MVFYGIFPTKIVTVFYMECGFVTASIKTIPQSATADGGWRQFSKVECDDFKTVLTLKDENPQMWKVMISQLIQRLVWGLVAASSCIVLLRSGRAIQV